MPIDVDEVFVTQAHVQVDVKTIRHNPLSSLSELADVFNDQAVLFLRDDVTCNVVEFDFFDESMMGLFM